MDMKSSIKGGEIALFSILYRCEVERDGLGGTFQAFRVLVKCRLIPFKPSIIPPIILQEFLPSLPDVFILYRPMIKFVHPPHSSPS